MFDATVLLSLVTYCSMGMSVGGTEEASTEGWRSIKDSC